MQSVVLQALIMRCLHFIYQIASDILSIIQVQNKLNMLILHLDILIKTTI